MELNLAVIHEAIAEQFPDRDCIVWRDRRFTWRETSDRTRRLANVLASEGIGRHRDLAGCAPWESPHDHVALYLLNGNEYLEGMLGSYKAAAAPFNVNYRYVADELAYVLNDAHTAVVIYHGRFAATLAEVVPHVPSLRVLLRVDDGSGEDLLPGAMDYEAALAAASPARPDVEWRPDDLYIVYTGGTTGQPKGVLWRQADFLVGALGTGHRSGREFASLDEILEVAASSALRVLPAPPFMHGAAHWNAISAWIAGGAVVIQDRTDHLDAADLLNTCRRERVTSLLVVGDAFARPLVDELARDASGLEQLQFLLTGGAILSNAVKAELLDALPGLRIVDLLGASETGRQGVSRSGGSGAESTFVPSPNTAVLSADRSRVLALDDTEVGWLAQRGRVPRGYLGDPDKTKTTFPVVDGQTMAIAGDRARYREDGSIELLGRDSATINTGGEKVFAEEVEQALKQHPAVYDALVVGRPSERWGQEVVAVVALREGMDASDEALRAACAEHLARYKLPKAFVRRDHVVRSPSGKPDYGWAREQALRC